MELQASMRRRVGCVIIRFGLGFEFHFLECEENVLKLKRVAKEKICFS